MTLSLIDPATPTDDQPAGLGGAEFRALKSAIQAQFPGTESDPFNIALTVGPRALNAVSSKADQSGLDATQAQADANSLSIAQINALLGSYVARIAALEGAGYVTAAQAANAAWPVGSIFIAYDGNTPTSKSLPGTWARIADGQVLLGADSGYGTTGGTMSKTLAEANLPAHRHLILTNTGVNNGPTPTANTSVQKNDQRGGGDLGWTLSAQADEPTLGRTSQTGSGTAVDITPAHIKVGIYRRTA